MSEDAVKLVEATQEHWRALETRFHHAYWDSQIEASPDHDRLRAELELEVSRAKGDRDLYRAVLDALDARPGDPELARSLEVLRLSLSGNQMDDDLRTQIVELSSAIESDFASFRPVLDGQRLSDNEIEEILTHSDDGELRRRAWGASKEIGTVVADRVRELARLRNEAARALGFPDYYRMSLDLQEIPEAWLFETMDGLDRLTAEPFRAWKGSLDDALAERFGTRELSPWHYSDPFFQLLPPQGGVSLDEFFPAADADRHALATFERWNVDLSDVIATSDLFPREHKCQHAFCIQMDRSKDVRILANIVPGERWVETMLHESGHAAYDMSIEGSLPYLLRRPAHTFTTEAMAIMSGRLVRDPRWLTEVAGIPEEHVAEIAGDLHAASAAQSLLFARWGLVMVYFERDLYNDPGGDLDARWWDLVERFQLVRKPRDRRGPDWAAKIHIAAAPVYYHNYLLGEMLASQLRAALERDCGNLIDASTAGPWLRERFFSPGASMPWDTLVERATGAPLSAADHAAYLSS